MAIVASVFQTYQKPIDKFYIPADTNSCAGVKLEIVIFLNKAFDSIPNEQFIEFFTKFVKNNLDQVCSKLASMIYKAIDSLEPSMFAAGVFDLLDLFLHINRRIRTNELPNIDIEAVVLHLVAFKTFLLRSLSHKEALKAFDRLLNDTMADLSKSRFHNISIVSLIFYIMPHTFGSLHLQMKYFF